MSSNHLIDLRIFAERLIKSPISSLQNVIVTPPMAKRCIVLNKQSWTTEVFHIESPLDHWTISQVYIDQDYRLDRLVRFAELNQLLQERLAVNHRSLILDAGANIGVSARYLAKQWSGCDVWLVEPSFRNIDLAQRNILPGMRVMHAALGSQDGHCRITNANDQPNAYRTADCSEQDAESCPMVSMPSILKEAFDIGLKPFILKVDIEGAEAEVF